MIINKKARELSQAVVLRKDILSPKNGLTIKLQLFLYNAGVVQITIEKL
jgi:hypothetical protein